MADITLPALEEGFEYVLLPKRKERIQELRERRDALKVELDLMGEPGRDELVEMAKFYHPYYQKQLELDAVKSEIANMK
jgi:hypothetical protein